MRIQPLLGPIADVRVNRRFMEGIIATIAKDDVGAQAAFTAARTEQEKIVQVPNPTTARHYCSFARSIACSAQYEPRRPEIRPADE